jgi:hypothetical protein
MLCGDCVYQSLGLAGRHDTNSDRCVFSFAHQGRCVLHCLAHEALYARQSTYTDDAAVPYIVNNMSARIQGEPGESGSECDSLLCCERNGLNVGGVSTLLLRATQI